MTKKIKIGYKIVSVWNGKYYSWMSYPDEDDCVEYRIGKTSKPRSGCGPLCIFSKLRNARDSVNIFTDIKCIIFKVQYVPSKENSVWTQDDSALIDTLIPDTVLANSVTPIKVIK
jgi:hypothetical protein